VLLVTAGNETTRTAIAHALEAFTRFADQRERLARDFEGLTATATDEIVRWASPVIWMRRTLASDFTLSGVDLRAGDKVLLFYNSALLRQTVKMLGGWSWSTGNYAPHRDLDRSISYTVDVW
jgi:cytochrome P450